MPNGGLDADHEGVGTVSATWSNRILVNGNGAVRRVRRRVDGPWTDGRARDPGLAGQKVRAALAWSSHTSGSNTVEADALMADLDLRVIAARWRRRRLLLVGQQLRGRRHHRPPVARFASRSGMTASIPAEERIRPGLGEWRGTRSSMPTSHPSARTSCGPRAVGSSAPIAYVRDRPDFPMRCAGAAADHAGTGAAHRPGTCRGHPRRAGRSGPADRRPGLIGRSFHR